MSPKYFLPVRAVAYYLEALTTAGFAFVEVAHLPVEAHVDQWYEFLSTYHEGVLGWVGGSTKVGDPPATKRAIADRLELLRLAMAQAFSARTSFQAIWTYITAELAASQSTF